MKCNNCGAELMPGVLFCRDCGKKVENKKRYCRECGAECQEGTKFCIECGVALDDEGSKNKSKEENRKEDSYNNIETEYSHKDKNDYKNRILNMWNKTSLLVKIIIIGLGMALLSTLISLISHNIFALITSILAIVGFVISYLMNENKIKAKMLFRNISLGCGAFFVFISIIFIGTGGYKAKNAKIPYSSSNCIGKKYDDVEKSFSEAGFANINFEEIEDVELGDTDLSGSVERVTINGNTGFEDGQKVERDAQIVITYHTFQKCNVKIHVNFVSNLLLNRYDVVLYVDDVEIGKLSHGVSEDYEISLKPDEHNIKFVSCESSTTIGEAKLNISEDTNVGYEISCYGNRIEVKESYFTQQNAITDEDIMMEKSSWEFCNFNYQDVKNSLEELGFYNIEEEILYDIVLGWTDSGAVESVSIDGTNDFNRGDVFQKSSIVTITYHMPYDDDPNHNETENSAEMGEEKTVSVPETVETDGNNAESTKYASATTKIKIRKESNTNCDVIGMLEEGDVVEIIEGEDDEWVYIKYNDVEGFVKNEFLIHKAEGSDESAESEPNKLVEEALSRLVSEEDKVEKIVYYKPSIYPKYKNSRTYFLPYLATRDNACMLHIKANYYNGDWVFWNKIVVAVDDERYEMKPGWLDTISQDIDDSGNVVETYDFSSLSSKDVDMLRAIVNSKETTIRFQGADRKYDFKLKDSDKQGIADVLNAFDAFEYKR